VGLGSARVAETFLARARPVRGRLSLGALGLALALLVSAAWGTGIFYLLVRLGTPSPVRLATLDGIHVYVGVVGGVFVVAKVARVGLRHRVDGVPNVMPWQRWLSWSLLALYAAVFVTGVLILLPVPGRVYADLVEMHLLTSIWALLPTTWHVWHYRSRALPYLRRWAARATGRRFWTAAVLVLLPTPLLMADAPAVSQLPAVLGGSAWSPAALDGAYLDAVALAPDGRTVVAAGDALYVSRDGGVVWVRVDLPANAPAPAPGQAATPEDHAGHEHGQPAPANPITSLVAGADGVLAGTPQGLYASGFDGPLTQVALPGGGDVRALAANLADPRTVWAASTAGPLRSTDGGRTWARLPAGLARPESVAAVGYLGAEAFLSDTTGVFSWDGAAGAWVRSSPQPSVAALSAAGDELYASSPDGDVWVLAHGRWSDLGPPAPVHNHHGHMHEQAATVMTVDGRLYAAGTSEGISASADGGRTWTQLGGGLGTTTPAQAIEYRNQLWAATAQGLYRFPLAFAHRAAPDWWLLVLGLAVGLGLAAVAVGGPDRMQPRRRAPAAPRRA
jgi:hypothetical protein